MGLDLAGLKANVSEYLNPRATLFKQAGADLIYGSLVASALMPIILTGSDLFAVLVPMLGDIGAGLIVNMVRGWKDKTDAAVARDILNSAQSNAKLRQAMDELLLKLDVIPAVVQAWGPADRQWFLEDLGSELARLQSSIKIEVQTDGGAVICGNVTVQNGDFVGRDKITYIINPLPPAPCLSALNQLPDPPADFVGRTSELDDLYAAVQEPGALLLTGLGGVGKTSLGLFLASRIKDQYPDGHLYLNLRGASLNPLTPCAAIERLIRAFEPTARLPDDLEKLTDIYRSLLANKRILVFLDDACDAAQVRPLLPPSPSLAILTSRKRFDLGGYHSCDISVLPLQDAEKLICAAWGQTADVTALANRCGLLPMALRAVGALLRRRPDLGPTEVEELLVDAARRMALADPEQETTIAAAFQASYDQLTPDLQTCWRSLSIFPCDFDSAAASAVWGTQDIDPGETLAKLRDAGLIDFVTGNHWQLHNLARDFTQVVCSSAELDTLAYRHAVYFKGVLAESNRLYQEGDENICVGLNLFDRERQNIEAGQAWVAGHLGETIAANLCNLYPDEGTYIISLRLHPRTQIIWLEAALTAARTLGSWQYQGKHLGNLGNVWLTLGEPLRAIEYFEQQLGIVQNTGDRRCEGTSLGNLGQAYAILKKPHQAIEYYEQALVIIREIDDKRSEGSILVNLGIAYKDLGKLHRAIEYYEQALLIIRETGDKNAEGRTLDNLGSAYLYLVELEKAGRYYEQALTVAREIGDQQSEANACWNLGCLLFQQGNFHRSAEFIQVFVDYQCTIEHPDKDKAIFILQFVNFLQEKIVLKLIYKPLSWIGCLVGRLLGKIIYR